MSSVAFDPTIIAPKNHGLAIQTARALKQLSKTNVSCTIRGEDVPYLANQLVREGRSLLAFTGDDLLDEWLAAGNVLDARLRRSRMIWSDPAAVYGAPALCLIGEPAFELSTRPREGLRIAVCARYRRLATRFLAEWLGRVQYDLTAITGSVETVVLHGVAELMIDVVVTGRTISAAGLRVHRVISTSDLAILEYQR